VPKERRFSKAAWLETPHMMNDIAEKVKPEGMRVGYHNHIIEFHAVEGETPWDLLFRATVPDVVMQLGTGNAMRGGVGAERVLEILKCCPGLAVTVHLKEFSSKNDKAW
jgi:hypothetical protein